MSASFPSVVAALRRGDFTDLDPLFAESPAAESSQLRTWIDEGRFTRDTSALSEALACACFNGRDEWVGYLLAHGASLEQSAGTGLNGLHWAVNRGQLSTVELMLRHSPNLETRNSYGGTTLGAAVWAAVHETKPAHPAIVAALLAAGADVNEAGYPTGHSLIDTLLLQYGAT